VSFKIMEEDFIGNAGRINAELLPELFQFTLDVRQVGLLVFGTLTHFVSVACLRRQPKG
jgi:hypothetical protein